MNKKSPSSLRTERLSFKQRLESLLLNITEHLEAEKYFNFSIPPHREITEALHHLIHMSGEPANLLIRYNDGSHGRPFPIRSLWLPDDGWNWQPNPRQHLHVGTLSFRHVIYDKYVDMYLVRDKETRRLLQGEIDSLAYQRMKQLLNAREFQGESYITVYQTGLEPLVIGIYRAIAEHLQERNLKGLAAIRIQPVFFIDEQEARRPDTGSIWGTGG